MRENFKEGTEIPIKDKIICKGCKNQTTKDLDIRGNFCSKIVTEFGIKSIKEAILLQYVLKHVKNAPSPLKPRIEETISAQPYVKIPHLIKLF
jgi:hypothetical protein